MAMLQNQHSILAFHYFSSPIIVHSRILVFETLGKCQCLRTRIFIQLILIPCNLSTKGFSFSSCIIDLGEKNSIMIVC